MREKKMISRVKKAVAVAVFVIISSPVQSEDSLNSDLVTLLGKACHLQKAAWEDLLRNRIPDANKNREMLEKYPNEVARLRKTRNTLNTILSVLGPKLDEARKFRERDKFKSAEANLVSVLQKEFGGNVQVIGWSPYTGLTLRTAVIQIDYPDTKEHVVIKLNEKDFSLRSVELKSYAGPQPWTKELGFKVSWQTKELAQEQKISEIMNSPEAKEVGELIRAIKRKSFSRLVYRSLRAQIEKSSTKVLNRIAEVLNTNPEEVFPHSFYPENLSPYKVQFYGRDKVMTELTFDEVFGSFSRSNRTSWKHSSTHDESLGLIMYSDELEPRITSRTENGVRVLYPHARTQDVLATVRACDSDEQFRRFVNSYRAATDNQTKKVEAEKAPGQDGSGNKKAKAE